MKEECQKYGSVVSLLIPKENPGKGQVRHSLFLSHSRDLGGFNGNCEDCEFLVVFCFSGVCRICKCWRLQRSPEAADREDVRRQVRGGHFLPSECLQKRLPVPDRAVRSQTQSLPWISIITWPSPIPSQLGQWPPHHYSKADFTGEGLNILRCPTM